MNATAILDLKARVRERDGNRCTSCGMTNENHRRKYGRILDVHRIEPGGPYTLNGCRTLCKSCHGLEPKRARGTPDMPAGVPIYRVSFDAENEVIRRTVFIAAAMEGVSHHAVMNRLIETQLAEYMTLAKKAVAAGEPAPRQPRGEK